MSMKDELLDEKLVANLIEDNYKNLLSYVTSCVQEYQSNDITNFYYHLANLRTIVDVNENIIKCVTDYLKKSNINKSNINKSTLDNIREHLLNIKLKGGD